MGTKGNNGGGLRKLAFGWKKFAIAALVFIGLVWAFGPRKEDILPEKYIPSESSRSQR